MRNPTLLLFVSTVATALLTGCDGSKSPNGSESPLPKTQDAVGTAAGETKKALGDAVSTINQNAKATANEVASKFVTMAKAQGDNLLTSIGQDLSAKAQSLVDSTAGNQTVKTNLESSLGSLTSGKDAEALTPAFQIGQTPGLTPTQLQLAKEVGNLASAFVVQRNFSSLSGAQGDVATLVNSLRNGQYAATLTPLKNIMNNASLTPSQKQLVGSIADKYAPALKQATGALQQGLQGLQGLPGTKK